NDGFHVCAYNYYYDYCKQYTFTTAIRMVAMEMFSDWITQIVLFILLGTVIELLLPDTRMKKYVNLILGLLLLLILSKPILFSVDTETVMRPFEQIIQEDSTYIDTEKEINKQKNEIQATQDAYIWNEIAAQLKQEANDHLPEEYGQELSNLQLKHDNDKEITAVIGTLSSSSKTKSADEHPIDQVEIDTTRSLEEGQGKKVKDKQLINYLADLWELDADIIHLEQEGGAN